MRHICSCLCAKKVWSLSYFVSHVLLPSSFWLKNDHMAKNIFKCNTERVELVTIPDRGFLDALFVMTTELFVPEFWAWHVDLVSLTPTWIRWSEKMAYQSGYFQKSGWQQQLLSSTLKNTCLPDTSFVQHPFSHTPIDWPKLTNGTSIFPSF